VGCLKDAVAQARGAADQPGLAWSRAGTLGLWAGLALQTGWALGDPIPGGWLKVVPALAFTALLHLIHVQGWKGSAARTAALWCWFLSAAVFGLLAMI
jgi:hypothetical protein